ncbi:MAG: dihydrodipicolinate synthase family protein [Bacteroidales bacterium]|nr:dihydrodipicolinate synthase family protein [Bacteroidales bacterium]
MKKYAGVVVPMVTPVTAEGKLDVEAVRRIVSMFVKHQVSPLLLGTTGEGNSVSRSDARLLVATAVQVAAGQIKVYAGLTGCCVSEQLEQVDAFCQAGADVIVATLPSYYALTPEQMYGYYVQLADYSKKPMMLYNILATTHMSIPVDIIKRLADHPNIVGLKDSERDLERMAQCVAFSKDRPDFSYFCGWAAQSAYSLSIGGDGIVPSTGNFSPGMFQDLYESAVAGNIQRAQSLQNTTNEIAKIYQAGRTLGQSLTALKVMMQTDGLCTPDVLLPLTRLSAAEEEQIAEKARAVSHY